MDAQKATPTIRQLVVVRDSITLVVWATKIALKLLKNVKGSAAPPRVGVSSLDKSSLLEFSL